MAAAAGGGGMAVAEAAVLKDLWAGFEYRAHQTTGVKWLLDRETEAPYGGLLCDEMGLGKTIEILGLMMNSGKRDTLLLCPKAVIQQWITTARKARINCFEFEGKTWRQTHKFNNAAMPNLFVTNYEKVQYYTSQFVGRPWDRIVLDEAHKVCNPDSKRHKMIMKMRSTSLWCVTATPVVNSFRDLVALFSLVGFKPKELGMASLYQKAETHLLHRSMEEMREIIADLPPEASLEEIKMPFDTEEEEEFFTAEQGATVARLKRIAKHRSTELLELLMRLRQLSVHPQVYLNAKKRKLGKAFRHPDWVKPSTKFVKIRQMLEDEEEPRRWLIFCQFHDEMDLLKEWLEDSPAVGWVETYSGRQTMAEKEAVIARTKVNETGAQDVLLIQLHSGGVGLNLQHFTRIIFMSPWWTAALMNQAIGRAVRIGQAEKVEVYRLLLEAEADTVQLASMDMWMMGKAEAKAAMLDTILSRASKGGQHVPGLEGESESEDEDEAIPEWARADVAAAQVAQVAHAPAHDPIYDAAYAAIYAAVMGASEHVEEDPK